jgi:subtilisin family serine protease
MDGASRLLALLIILVSFKAFAGLHEAVPGEYIVKLRDNFQFTSKENLSKKLRSYIKSTIPSRNIVVIKRPVFEQIESVVSELTKNEDVEIVEPNFIYHISKKPNDPDLDKLWGLQNFGQLDSAKKPGIPGVDIGAVQAWDIETGSKDVIVAVIDTGINYDHRDLKNNIWTNQIEFKGKPGIDDDNNGIIDDIYGASFAIPNAPSGENMDDHGHGSHCSGTIGGSGDDGQGIVGVNWNVRLMGVKFLSADGAGSLEGALKAIDYATQMGARVLSNSWGGGGYSETLKQAIQRSNDAGTVFIAASGNESNNNDATPSYPASYDVPNVISVGAINNRGALASFSNFGKKTVHVAAPGVNIYSSVDGDGYESMSGTSMAAPHVSGVAALLFAHEPQLTNIQLKERIISTSRPIPGTRGKIFAGLVNAHNALTNAMPEPDENDPQNWKSVVISISSPHPYKSGSNEIYEVKVPGAQKISIYFSKFDTETNFDKVEFFNASGQSQGEFSGRNDNSYSPVIDGEYVKMVFTSDLSVNRNGWEAVKAYWK